MIRGTFKYNCLVSALFVLSKLLLMELRLNCKWPLITCHPYLIGSFVQLRRASMKTRLAENCAFPARRLSLAQTAAMRIIGVSMGFRCLKHRRPKPSKTDCFQPCRVHAGDLVNSSSMLRIPAESSQCCRRNQRICAKRCKERKPSANCW